MENFAEFSGPMIPFQIINKNPNCDGYRGKLNSFKYGLKDSYKQNLQYQFNNIGKEAQYNTISPYSKLAKNASFIMEAFGDGTGEGVDVIVAAYNDASGVSSIQKLIETHLPHARLFVYEKSDADVSYTNIRMPNIGREQNTFIHHIITHYDDLAPLCLFTPSNVKAHHIERLHFMKRFFETHSTDEMDFRCITDNNGTLQQQDDFRLQEYDGRSLESAGMQLSAWSREHVGYFDAEQNSCFHGTFTATRRALQRTAKDKYEHLLRQLSTPEPEAGHYVERLASHIYAREERNS